MRKIWQQFVWICLACGLAGCTPEPVNSTASLEAAAATRESTAGASRQAPAVEAEAMPAAGDSSGGDPPQGATPGQAQGRSGLPFAQGRTFHTLDEYLAHLRKRGAYDIPWYREVSPGVYEVVTRRRPGTPPRRYTRQELLDKFGFTQ